MEICFGIEREGERSLRKREREKREKDKIIINNNY